MRVQKKSTAESLSRGKGALFRLQEIGARKKPWRGRLKIALVYPNSYYVGMSNLGFQQIYGLWNDLDEVVCERAFLNENGEAPRTLESDRPLSDFDVIAFTLSFENDSIHVLRLLSQMGLPLKAEDRSENDPLIIMGGAAPSMNPLPLFPFIDLFAFGDGEEMVFDLAQTLRESPFLRHHKKKLLERLIEIPGTFAPRLQGEYPEKKIARRTIKFLNSYLTKSEILTNYTEFSNLYLVEVSRGCPQRCRFCSVSYTEASTRFRRLSFLKSAFEEGIERVGRIGLVGAALSDHPELLDMADTIRNMGGEISLSSLRVEAVSQKLIQLLVASKQRTLTLALETASPRLQEIIHKKTSWESVLNVVEVALNAGVKNLKFYFIIGLPTEQPEDIFELSKLVKKVHEVFFRLSRERGSIGTLSVSLNPWIPKPTTPFEACAHLRVEDLENRFQMLKSDLGNLPHLELNHEGWDTAQLQSLLSVGGAATSDFLLDVHSRGDRWRSSIQKFQPLLESTIYRPKGIAERLPWSFITK